MNTIDKLLLEEKHREKEKMFHEKLNLFLKDFPLPKSDFESQKKLYEVLIGKILRLEDGVEHLSRLSARDRLLK